MDAAPTDLDRSRSWFEGDEEALRVLDRPEVADALRRGDPKGAYDAVRRLRGKATSAVERAAIERVLANRRAFALPLSTARRAWRWAALGVPLLLAAWIVLAILHAATRQTVWVVNALDVPVAADAGGETVLVPSRAARKVSVETGTRRLVARTEDGRTIEALEVEVPGGSRFAAWNVLGAAAIAIRDVVYSVGEAGEESEGDPEWLVGTSFLVRDRVQHAFERPPRTIKTPGSREVRRHAFLAEGGWREVVEGYAARHGAEKAADLASRVAVAQGDEAAIDFAGDWAARVALARYAKLGDDLVAAHPDSIAAHRVRQDAMRASGRKDEAAREYRARFEKDRTSAANGYLHARTVPRAEALPLLERLVAEHEDDPWLRRGVAWHLFQEGRFAEAVPHYERLAALAPAFAKNALSQRARSLAAVGRVAEAQRMAREGVAPGDWDAVILHGFLSRLPGGNADESAVESLLRIVGGEKADVPALRAELAAHVRDREEFQRRRDDLKDAAVRDALDLSLLALSDPEAGAAAVEKASEAVRENLIAEARITLTCEALRTGRDAAARALWPEDARVSFDAVKDPAALLSDEDLDPQAKAVYALAASRRAKDPAERDRFVALARRLDVLKAVVPR